MKWYIAIASAKGQTDLRTTASLIALVGALKNVEIEYAFRGRAFSDVVTNRNLLASDFFGRTDYTHFLSVDDDMEFDAPAVARLSSVKAALIGCIYQRRGPDGGLAAKPLPTRPAPRNGIVELAAIGMGLCLIARSVFDGLAAMPDMRVQQAGQGRVYGFFDQIRDGDELLPEDLSFCHRWRASGGKVLGITDANVGHIDTHVLRGRWPGEITAASEADPAVPRS